MMGNGVQDKVHVVCVWRPLVVSQENNCDTSCLCSCPSAFKNKNVLYPSIKNKAFEMYKCKHNRVSSADRRLGGPPGGGGLKEWIKRICPCFTPPRITLMESAPEALSLPRFFFSCKSLYDVHVTRFD